MSFIFSAQYPQGPTPTSPAGKDIQVKAVKLTNIDFTTGGTASVKAYIAADASIVGFRLWVKTQLAGGSISAAVLSIGIPGTAGKYVPTVSAFGAAGVMNNFNAVAINNLFAEYDPTAPGGDIPLLFTGTSTTGNPTSGELYVLIEYVR